MIKFAKFIFVALFLFSFSSDCKAAGKVAPNKSFKEPKVILSGEFPLAYEFKLNDLKGGEVALSSYKDKKVVVLVFWTTWCPYCREALKSLQADFKSIANMGVELLAINVAEPKHKVDKFAQAFKLSFRVLLDQNASVADHYGLLGVPTYVIINKSGQIVFNGNRFTKEKLKELTAE